MAFENESLQLKRGFGMLFKEDTRKYLTKIRDIIYPDFGLVSGIILSYLCIRLPENLTKHTFIYANKIEISYSYLLDNGFSMLDYKHLNIGDLMLFLDLIPEIGLSLNACYYMNDINTYFKISLDLTKLHLYGYDKFSINITHESAIKKKTLNSPNNVIMNQYFMLANYPNMLFRSIELRSILMYNANTQYMLLFDNMIKESVLGMISTIYPKELEIMGNALNIKNYANKIIVCDIRVSPASHEKTKAICSYKTDKYPLPDAIKWMYAVREHKQYIRDCKYHNYIIYFNKYHFIIQLYP